MSTYNRCNYIILKGKYRGLRCGVDVNNSDSIENNLCAILPENNLVVPYRNLSASISSTQPITQSCGFNVKCPICRTSNYISNNIKKVKGLDIKCCICDDNNADIHFNEYSHINSCHECVTKLKI